ncbi:hypothetical protein B0J18DRAFT_266419 [Chaetomium sp. MPI-SDFR-AT-0129]|nr:hypothetical protein B0J18DRAFT_266419 [Chaetomium sp. MPI-SDFR-AT-0129]
MSPLSYIYTLLLTKTLPRSLAFLRPTANQAVSTHKMCAQSQPIRDKSPIRSNSLTKIGTERLACRGRFPQTGLLWTTEGMGEDSPRQHCRGDQKRLTAKYYICHISESRVRQATPPFSLPWTSSNPSTLGILEASLGDGGFSAVITWDVPPSTWPRPVRSSAAVRRQKGTPPHNASPGVPYPTVLGGSFPAHCTFATHDHHDRL